jgi:hypothetical protein
MTSFHLKEMECFDQNDLFWFKMMLFCVILGQNNNMRSDDLSFGYCSSSSIKKHKKTDALLSFPLALSCSYFSA